MIEVNEITAAVIMAALATTYSEGYSDYPNGLDHEVAYKEEVKIVKLLYKLYPKIVLQYGWISHVKEIINGTAH